MSEPALDLAALDALPDAAPPELDALPDAPPAAPAAPAPWLSPMAPAPQRTGFEGFVPEREAVPGQPSPVLSPDRFSPSTLETWQRKVDTLDALLKTVPYDVANHPLEAQAAVHAISRKTNVDPRIVEENLPGFVAASEAAGGDAARILADNPLLADALLDHPDAARTVFRKDVLTGLGRFWSHIKEAGALGAAATAREQERDRKAIFDRVATDEDSDWMTREQARLMAAAGDKQAAIAEAAAGAEVAYQTQRRDNPQFAPTIIDRAADLHGFLQRTFGGWLQVPGGAAGEASYQAPGWALFAQQAAREQLQGSAIGIRRAWAENVTQDRQSAWEAEKDALALRATSAKRDYGAGLGEQAIYEALNILPSQGLSVAAAVGGGLVAGGAGAAAGLRFAQGYKLGMLGGGFLSSWAMEAGGDYNDLRDTPMENGERMSPGTAFMAASVGGALKAAVEVDAMIPLLRMLGPLGELAVTGERAAMRGALMQQNRLGRGWLKDLVQRQAAGAYAESREEFLQQILGDLAGYAGRVSEQGIAATSADPIGTLESATDVGLRTFVGMMVAGVPASGVNLATRLENARRVIYRDGAIASDKKLGALIDYAKGNVALKVVPEFVADAIKREAEASGEKVDKVWFTASEVQRLFQEDAGEDAAWEEAAKRAGFDPNEVKQAAAAGKRVGLPLETYLAQVATTPLAEALQDHTSTKQQTAFPTRAERAAEDATTTQETKRLVQEWSKNGTPEVESDAEQEMVDAIMDLGDDHAAAVKGTKADVVKVWRAFVRTQAKRWNEGKAPDAARITADDLFRSATVRIRKGSQAELTGDSLAQGTRLEAAFREKASGRIVATGPLHDTSAVPDFRVDRFDEGFVDPDGRWLTRQEAKALRDSEVGPTPNRPAWMEAGQLYGEEIAPPGILNVAAAKRAGLAVAREVTSGDGQVTNEWRLYQQEAPQKTIGRRTAGSSVGLRQGRETLAAYGVKKTLGKKGAQFTTREVALALEKRQRAKVGVIEPGDTSEEASKKIASWMADEIRFEHLPENIKTNGVGWYSEKWQRAIDAFGELFPDLRPVAVGGKQVDRNLFTALVAITSDGAKVYSNFKMAAVLYQHWKKTGRLDGAPLRSYRGAVKGNVARIQEFIDIHGLEKMHEELLREETVKELSEAARGAGVKFKSSYRVDVKLPFAALIFGPKLGAFYANLMGAGGYLTMDRWWARTFNRYRGTLIPTVVGLAGSGSETNTKGKLQGLAAFKDALGTPSMSDEEAMQQVIVYHDSYEAKGFKHDDETKDAALQRTQALEKASNTIYKAAFTELNDTPWNASDRSFMIETVQRARRLLKASGITISVADIQAVLWYYEKRLWGEMGTRQTADVSYEETAHRVVRETKSGVVVDDGVDPTPDDPEESSDAGAAGAGLSGPAGPNPSPLLEGPDGNLWQAPPETGGSEPVFESPEQAFERAQLAGAATGEGRVKLDDDKLFQADGAVPGFPEMPADLLQRLQTPDGGFTYNPTTGTEPTVGYSVSPYPARSESMDPAAATGKAVVAYATRNWDILSQPGAHLGAWHNPASGKVFLDISIVSKDEAQARQIALDHDQIAYYDLVRHTSVTVNASATSGGAATKGAADGTEAGVAPGPGGGADQGGHLQGPDAARGAALGQAGDAGGVRGSGGDVREAAGAGPGEVVRQEGAGAGTVRGWMDRMREGLQRIFQVVLTENANASTLIHESAHVFLELFADIAERPDAPQSVKDDWQATLKWMGLKDRAGLKREHHEKWARSFEQYLLQGKAPSLSLQGAFTRFSLWLRAIYRAVSGVPGAQVSDDIHAVFDRLLATEREIENVRAASGLTQPLFRSPHEMGATAAEWQEYLAAQRKVQANAQREAELAVAKERLRASESWWKQQAADVRAAAEEQWAALPGVVAWSFLRSGKSTNPALAGLTGALNRQKVLEAIPAQQEEVRSRLHGRISKSGTVDVNDLAPLLGFSSAKEMLQAALEAPSKQDFARTETDRVMAERHGDIATDITRLRELIGDALHSEPTLNWLEREWAALRSRVQQGPGGTPLASIKAAAEVVVERTALADLSYLRILRDERSAAEAAFKAAARGDYAAALVAKQQQLLAYYIYRAAREAQDDARSFVRRLESLGKPDRKALGRIGLVTPEYRDFAEGILERLGVFVRNPGARVITQAEHEQSLADDALAPAYDESIMAWWLDHPPAAPRTRKGKEKPRYLALDVATMRTVDGALRQVQAISGAWAAVKVGNQKMGLQELLKRIAAEAAFENTLKRRPAEGGNNPWWWSVYSKATRTNSEWTDPQYLVELLGKTAEKFFWGRYLDGKAKEEALQKTVTGKFHDLWTSYVEKNKDRLFELLPGDLGLPVPAEVEASHEIRRDRMWLLMVALNMGTDGPQGNRVRLLGGMGWNEGQVLAALGKYLTPADLKFVEKVWGIFDGTLWPEMAAVRERVDGIEPPKLRAAPFTVPMEGGTVTVRGGYFPAKYNALVDLVGAKQEAAGMQNLLSGQGVQPAVSKSFTKTRDENVKRVVSLDWRVVPQHVYDVVHFVGFEEVVRDINRVLKSSMWKEYDDLGYPIETHLGMRQIVQQRLGPGGEDVLDGWLKAIAGVRSDMGSAASATLDAALFLKTRFTGAMIAGSLPVAMGDIPSVLLPVATGEVSVRWGAASILYALSPVGGFREMRAQALKFSPRLRSMAETTEERMRHELAQLGELGRRGKFRMGLQRVREMMRVVNLVVEKTTSTICWWAKWREALRKGGISEEQAGLEADKVIEHAYPSPVTAEQSALMRDRKGVGLLMAFFSYFNKQYTNVLRRPWHPLVRALHNAEDSSDYFRSIDPALRAFAATVASLVVIGPLSELFSGRGPEDDESTAEWLLRKTLMTPTLFITGMSDVAAGFEARYKGKRPSERSAPTAAALFRLREAVDTAFLRDDKEEFDRLVALLEVAGFGLGVGMNQPRRTLKWLNDSGGRGPQGIIYGPRTKFSGEDLFSIWNRL